MLMYMFACCAHMTGCSCGTGSGNLIGATPALCLKLRPEVTVGDSVREGIARGRWPTGTHALASCGTRTREDREDSVSLV